MTASSYRRSALMLILLAGFTLFSGCGDDEEGPGPGDVTPPAITEGPTVLEITASSAEIRWTTNEVSTSTVFWSADTTVAWEDTSDPTRVRNHSMPLTGLEAETEYLVAVQSTDASGNTSERSDPASFTTFSALPTLLLDPWETTVTVGDTLRLAVRVLNVTDLFGVSFNVGLSGGRVAFDDEALSVGPFLGEDIKSLFMYDLDAEVLEVAITRLHPADGVGGDGTLAWLHLIAEQSGLAVADLAGGTITLVDPSGAPITDFDQLVVEESRITVQ